MHGMGVDGKWVRCAVAPGFEPVKRCTRKPLRHTKGSLSHIVTTVEPDHHKPVVIVLAAGLGTRFRASGAAMDKLDAPLSGRRMRDHVLGSVRASGLPWHVVDRAQTAHIARPGMGWSIACGVAATRHATGWLILPADLPLVRSETLLAVAAALRNHEVVLPTWQGTQGHPVGFSSACRDALLALQGDEGARSIASTRQALRLAVNDPGCVLDVDTWDALQSVQALFDKMQTENLPMTSPMQGLDAP